VGIHATKKLEDFSVSKKDAWEKPTDQHTPVIAPHIVARPVKHAEMIAKGEGIGVAPDVHKHEDARASFSSTPPRPIPTPKMEIKAKDKETRKSGWSFFTDEQDSGSREISATAEQKTSPLPESFPRAQEPVLHPTVTPLVREMVDTPSQQTPIRLRETLLTKPSAHSSQKQLPSVRRSFIPLLRTILFIIVIGVAAVLGILAGIFTISRMSTNSGEEQAPPTSTPSIPSFLSTTAQIAVPLSSSKNDLMTALINAKDAAPSDIVQFYPVRGEPSKSNPATVEEILDVMNFAIPGSFSRSLGNTMMIGSVMTNAKEPFIIFRSNTFDVAFAGMLYWEPQMSEDLAPLFGEPVKKTLAPLTNAKAPHSAFFTDALRDNRSIRILYDEAKNERIIYAFVNRSTIIITTSTEALAEILRNLK
jgi:hypothetical protein